DVIPPWRLGRSWLRTLRQFLIALTILIAAWNVVCLARDGREVTRQATELRESMSRLAARADNLYVVFGSHYPYHHILPFGDIGFMRSMKILGTLHNTGFNKRRMREFGVSDVYRALYERDDLFL